MRKQTKPKFRKNQIVMCSDNPVLITARDYEPDWGWEYRDQNGTWWSEDSFYPVRKRQIQGPSR